MADLTERMSAADFLAMQGRAGAKPAPKRKAKYGNKRGTLVNGEKYDSKKEAAHHQVLLASRFAVNESERVVSVKRQVPYVLLEKQEGERGVKYIADFVVEFADGRVEVHDTKSPITRIEKVYVIKRKLMLSVHRIVIQEF